MQILMFSSEEPPASPSALQAFAMAWLTTGAISPSPSLKSLNAIAPPGWYGRTCPGFCPPTKDGPLAPSSEGWGNSGMGTHTGCLTLSSTEWPSNAVVCSLSDVLEDGPLPLRYFLTPKACAGILRRAAKRGKELPPPLRDAL